MDFYNKLGQMAIGSRLRMLTDIITEDASRIYQLYGMDFKAKWFPVFYLLSDGKSRTITGIAGEIGHSHPSVSAIIREMSAKGLVRENKDKTDGRRNMIELSEEGKTYVEPMHQTLKDVGVAVEAISRQSKNDLWKAIEEWEFLLSEKSLLKYVEEVRKERESRNVAIIPYQSQYHEIFKDLNEDWITTHFEMEEADHKALDNPEEYILKNGGYIFIALYKDRPVGACALIKMNDNNYDFELAKMAVDAKVRGQNIGYLLGEAAISKARELGANKLYLESNTILIPAIKLYSKLGFKKIVGHDTPYKRCNIQMELNINN
ncbi:MAG: bifunctional helix-turn-helix transcriptional regulator/GNAT family N-acetyltransferase [Prevotella sp.]|jgi:DNA-binding MarR family transcriptional regulator/N-acetylglutamate synthase-like GNAT family acetyltransferase|nr:bifunctional helix-turn-helix transcriptional regulator/GNAT family N-acetyltransferase [Prevotella sp.]